MNEPSDSELLDELKRISGEYGYTLKATIACARDWMKWHRHALIVPQGPYPKNIDEVELTHDVLDAWPEWIAELVPVGSKWERLHWPDGSVSIQLVTPRNRVLASEHFPSIKP